MFENTMKVEFPSKSQNESFARVVVAAFASQLDPTIEDLSDIRTAISEAVTNAIIHGYENNDNGIVKIEAFIKDKNFMVTVEDKGKGIDDIELAMQPLFTSRPDLERSGMGFTVMETFMDSLKVESEKGLGTKITMEKSFKSLE